LLIVDTTLLRATPASTPGYVPVITGRRIAVVLSNGDWMVWRYRTSRAERSLEATRP